MNIELLKNEIQQWNNFPDELYSSIKKDLENIYLNLNMLLKNWKEKDLVSIEDEIESFIIHNSINCITTSSKLLLNCDLIASGSLYRNFIESIALYLICYIVDRKELNKLKKVFKGARYPFHTVVRRLNELIDENNYGINPVFAKQLKDDYSFNCGFSHFTVFSFGASLIKDNNQSQLIIGGYYDKRKNDIYKRK